MRAYETMTDNTLQFGITVDTSKVASNLSQIESQFQQTTSAVASQWTEASSTISASLAKMAEGAEQAAGRTKEQIEKASGAVGLLSDIVGVQVPESLQRMLASTEVVGPALELAFPVFAGLAMVDVLKNVGEKLAEVISDTFIFTEAEKEADRALKSANVALAQRVARVKELGREMQIAAATTAAEKDKLRLQFTLEDLGGDPAALRAKLDAAREEWKKALAVVNTTNKFFMHGELDEAQAKMRSLENTIPALTAALQEAEAQSKKFGKAIKADLAVETKKAVDDSIEEFRKEARAKNQLSNEIAAASQQAAEQALAADKQANDQIIKDAKEAFAVQETYYRGDMEVAKVNEQTKEKLAEAALAAGKITRAQEIEIVRQAKQAEIQQEIQALREIEALYDQEPRKAAEIEAKIRALKAQEGKIDADAAAAAARTKETQWKKALSGMQAAFSSFTQGLISGHKTLAQSWVDLVDGMEAKFLEGLERQLMASIEHSIQQTVIHVQTAAEGDAIDKANSAKSGLRAAYDAAKGAWKWAANNDLLPFAPIIAAGTFAAVEAFGSAEGGQWEVPGLQMTMLHPQEMVLPAGIASRMRDMVEGGSPRAAGLSVHFNVNAIDGQDAADFIGKNSRNIANAVAKELKKKGLFSK